jgi:hypothetical protein
MRAAALLVDFRVEVAEPERAQAVLRRELADDLHVEVDAAVRSGVAGGADDHRHAELREASSICSRSCVCQASGLVEVSLPSGIGPDVVAAGIRCDVVPVFPPARA